jgi:hypothetical protein
MAKRNKEKARKMRSGTPPYTRAKRAGDPKKPCLHCQQITRDLKRGNHTHEAHDE